MASQITGGVEVAVHVYQALYGKAPSFALQNSYTAQATANENGWANQMAVNFNSMTDSAFATMVMNNIGLTVTAIPTVYTALQAAFTGYLTSVGVANRGIVTLQLTEILSNLENAPGAQSVYSAAAFKFNDLSLANFNYGSNSANTEPADLTLSPVVAGTTFALAPNMALGADVMRLTGDQGVRIDFSNPANQIKGLDLNGNGTIANDGVENVITGRASGFEIVDAYSRSPLNETDRVNNFLGNIAFDGTGFGGDGTATNGNIFLGGLGADTALGGNGNDFMAGGGIASTRTGTDTLSGGRNADFFFVEMSTLDNTDQRVSIDGGVTADDNSAGNTQSAMDADWLLFEGSDDDEPYTIVLRDDTILDLTEIGAINQTGSVTSRSNKTIGTLRDIENFDASGNLYGFIKNIDVQLGGRGTDSRDPAFAAAAANNGQGSSSQLEIEGSNVANIIIGGFDNDVIRGNAGDDLLMGGNVKSFTSNGTTIAQQLLNPNLLTIVNDGRDELYGGAGNDNIVFEADRGVIDGDAGNDTLWITANSLGVTGAGVLGADATLRFDLLASNLANSAGYGGADVDGTQDQTLYSTASASGRVTTTGMESVIVTGLGAIDYLASGSNRPELTFDNQQNHQRYNGNVALRGTNDANTLYASSGKDVIEGRGGNDMLSGGDGKDDFVFQIAGQGGNAAGDGIDVIHRQNDVNSDNIWDGTGSNRAAGSLVDAGTFGQDFAVNGSSIFGPSSLSVDFAGANLADPNVAMGTFSVKIGTVTFAVTDLVALRAITTVADLAFFVNAAFQVIDPKVAVTAVGTVLTITDSTSTATSGGRVFSVTQATGYDVNVQVQAPGTGTLTLPVFTPAGATPSEDRLIFAAYEDRLDGELVDDNGNVNSTGDGVTLGRDGYAEDLVVRFGSAGTNTQGSSTIGDTILAEDQTWNVTLTNLADKDTVKVTVNGTAFALQMGVAANGTAIIETDVQFVARMASFINSVADANTLAGSLAAAAANTVLTFTQGNGGGAGGGAGQNVFMDRPVVELGNASGGQPAAFTITKTGTNSEITIADYDGRGGLLNAANVLFVGGSAMDQGAIIGNGLNNENAMGVANTTSRSVLATAVNATATNPLGSTLNGANALVLDSMTDVDLVAADFSLHGDDFLIGGTGNDTLMGGTGDDRFQGSASSATVADIVNGGKDLYVVTSLVNGLNVKTVETLNAYGAAQRADTTIPANATVLNVDFLAEDAVGGAVNGFTDALVFNQNDFTAPATTNFYITVGRAGDTARLQQQSGGEGTVQVGTFNSTTSVFTQTQGSTAFAEMEAIRTLAGDGTRAGQGRDTLDVSLISGDVAASFASAIAANAVQAGVTVNLRSDTSAIRVVADMNANDADNLASETIANFLAVAGVENVIGGNANDTVNIDESEVRKDNTFTGGGQTAVLSATVVGLSGDVISYDHSDMDNNVLPDIATQAIADAAIAAAPAAIAAADALVTAANAAIAAALLTPAPGDDLVAAALLPVANIALALANTNLAAAQAYYARPSVNLKVGATTDLVTMSGGTMLSDSPVDTLNGVEGIQLNDLARSSLRDTLDVTAIAGSTVDFQTGKVFSGAISAANLLIDIGNMTELEMSMLSVTGADTVLIADTMTNNNAVAWTTNTAAAGIPDFNNGFAFFRGAVNTVAVANQGLFDIDFGTGTGASTNDAISYVNELNQDIMVVLDLSGTTNVDRVVVADAAGIDGALNTVNARVDVLRGADLFYAGGTNARFSGIDLSQHTGNLLTVQFSSNATALNAAGGTGEDVRNIQIVDGTTSVIKQFIDNGLTTADRAAIAAPGSVVTADMLSHYWNRIEGNDLNETINLTDRESDHAIAMNLFGGNNTISYNDDSIGNTLRFASVLTGAKQSLTVDLTTSNPLDGTNTHTITGNVGSQRVDGSKTGNDILNMAAVVGAYAIKLNNIEGSGWKGSVTQYQVDGNNDGLYTTAGVDSIAVATTVSGYENITGNNANNSYEANTFVNAITAGSGNDAFTISNFTDITGDTWRAGTGVDTLIIASGVSVNGAGVNTITLGNGALGVDQFVGTTNVLAYNGDLQQFENVDASGSATSTTTFTLTGRTDMASMLRGGAGNDTITSALGGVIDGGAGADAVNFGAAATIGQYEFGDSDSASRDVASNFNSATDSIAVRVDMGARGLTNVLTGFATGATAVGNSGTVLAFYDTTASTLVVDMDANGSFSASGDLTIGGTGAVVAGDIQFDILGSTGNNTITGSAGIDRIRGNQGVDVVSGGDLAAVGTVHSYVLSGVGLGAGDALILDGFTVTEGVVVQGTVVALSDADAVGSAFVRQWNANPASFANQANLTSVTYNALTNSLDFNFKPTLAAVPAAAIGAAGGSGAAIAGAELVSVAFAAAVGSNDVFVVVGSVDATQAQVYSGKYASQEAVNADLGGANLVNLTTDLLTVHTTSDAAAGDSINGNLGTDTLHIYGDADLSTTTLTSIEAIVVHSTLRLSVAQVNALSALGTSISFDADGVGTLVITGATATSNIDLSGLALNAGTDKVVLAGLTTYTGQLSYNAANGFAPATELFLGTSATAFAIPANQALQVTTYAGAGPLPGGTYSITDVPANMITSPNLNLAVNVKTITTTATNLQTVAILAATNTGTTTIHAATATGTEAAALVFGINESITALTVTAAVTAAQAVAVQTAITASKVGTVAFTTVAGNAINLTGLTAATVVTDGADSSNNAVNLGAGAATYVFASTAALNGSDAITGFTSGTDKLNVDALTTLLATTAVPTVATNPVVGAFYFLSGAAATQADSAVGLVAALGAAGAMFSTSTATAYFVVVDNNSSAIYQWVDVAATAGVAAGELTLIGSVDALVVPGDIIFGG